MEEVISLRDVTKKFGDKLVFENASFNVHQGHFVGILGGSGSGKSVILNLITEFFEPTSGSVSVKSKVGFSSQSNSLYESLSAGKNLNYFAELYEIKNKKETIDRLARMLSIEEYLKIPVRKLSGGTQKRVDIACALLEYPKILVLDEPFAGLDSFLVKQFSEFLTELKKGGTTIIISSHLINQIENLCNRYFFIDNHQVKEISKGELKNLYANKK